MTRTNNASWKPSDVIVLVTIIFVSSFCACQLSVVLFRNVITLELVHIVLKYNIGHQSNVEAI